MDDAKKELSVGRSEYTRSYRLRDNSHDVALPLRRYVALPSCHRGSNQQTNLFHD